MTETTEMLDSIATTIGENGGSSELLNAVHACRPGHPLNARAEAPFQNLRFMLAGRGLVTGAQADWIVKQSGQEPRRVRVNGPEVVVTAKTDRPRTLMLSESCATTTSRTGEEIEIVRSATNPFFFQLRGEKLTADLDLSSMIQEALLHVVRENA